MKSAAPAAVAAASISCHGGCRPCVGDVLGDRRREEHGLLQHDPELPTKVDEADVAKIDAVEEDPTFGRVVEARQQAHKVVLPAPVRPEIPSHVPGSTSSRTRLEYQSASLVLERHVLERERAAGSVDRLMLPVARPHLAPRRASGTRARRPTREDCKVGDLRADLAQRREEHRHVGHDDQQVAKGHRASLNGKRAHDEDRCRAQCGRDADQQLDPALCR